jgi:hypothetical protein
LFPSARWKAYLKNLQDAAKDSETGGTGENRNNNILQIYHSEKLWFVRDEVTSPNKNAEEQLEQCDALLDDCTIMVDALEETLANTPKPSEVLDWGTIW